MQGRVDLGIDPALTQSTTFGDIMLEHAHDHPSLVISLRTRTRAFGTKNFALALRGRSCGWGSCDRPRRAFFGRARRSQPDTGLHFIELAVLRDSMCDERVLFRFGDPIPGPR